MAALTTTPKACEPKICEVGGKGNILPAFGDDEQEWNQGLRAVLYCIGLGWTFMGVAIVADVFMGAIERITSKKKKVIDSDSKRVVTMKVWNDTVANLTLMALGSSAPEILLSVIELVTGKMYSGELGPSTIVGSAAFNLLCISAVCVVAIPNDEVRYIKDTHVFIITAGCSVFAYIWLYFIVIISSENVIKIWEAAITFLMFPLLVAAAYHADRGGFSSATMREETTHKKVTLAEVSKEELAEMEVKIFQKYGDGETEMTDDQLAKLIEKEHGGGKSRAQYRVAATRNMVGGKKVAAPSVQASSHSASAVVPITEVNLKIDDMIIEFASTTYAVLESVGKVAITVRRVGCPEQKAFVDYKTRDGTAVANSDYTPVEGTLEFMNGEEEKTISITIIDDTAYEDDEEFFVDLTNARCYDANFSAALGRNTSTKIAIVDDDEPGILVFTEDKDLLRVAEPSKENKVTQITVKRKDGSNGNISCKYHTEDGTATGGRDFLPAKGELKFADGQTSGHVDVTICPRGRYDTTEEFSLVLTEPTNGARFDPNTDGGADSAVLTVVIEADENDRGRVDRVMQVLQLDWDKAQIGHVNWADQFRDAIFVNGGGDDEDNPEPPGVMDWIMHIITIFWKVLFACIPPADFCDGWACFICALCMIGGVTAIIGDMAGLLGCVLELRDSVTAITFVALGTSLPDTFASKTAAEQDPHADASIGNITGSNSVNVFLGLGLPWMLGAIYWNVQDSRPAKWVGKYPEVVKEMGAGSSDVEFVVMGGDLGFSVVVFSICAIVCIGTLVWRRRAFGGELGGPAVPKYLTAAFFVLLWFVYIALSTWKAMSADDPCK